MALFVLVLCARLEAQNLVTNGSFDSNLAGWTCGNCSGISWSSQDAHGSPSSGSLKIDASTAASADYPLSEVASANITAGVTYSLSAYINDNTTTAWRSTVNARWEDAEGNDLGLAWQFASNVKSAWMKGSTTTGPAPAGATRLRIILDVRTVQATPATTSYTLFDDIAVVAYYPPPTATFGATPSTIALGQSSSLSWTTTNTTSLSIDNGVGSQPVNGSASVSPTNTTTYTLTASGAGGTITKRATVTVNDPPTITFSASPAAIATGGTSTLTWTTANASTVSIDNAIGAKPLSGSLSVTPAQTTTYHLTATGTGGTRTAAATVTIAPAPTIVFTATPPTVLPGGSVKLEWQVFDAMLVIIDPDLGAQPFAGTVSITPKATTTYTLTATGTGGVRSMTVTVAVGGKRRAAKH